MPRSLSYITPAIILSRKDWRAWDRLYTVLTPEGKKEIRAIGSRRPQSKLAGRLEPWQMTTMMIIRGKNSDIIADSRPELGWHVIRLHFPGYFFASSYTELLHRLIPLDDPSPELYNVVSHHFLLLREIILKGSHNRDEWRKWWVSASSEIMYFSGILPEGKEHSDSESLQWWLSGVLDSPMASFPLLRRLL